ncbi:uncharacterized protein LOC119836805 [Zerene cesonia]|uniref:uncharacterized protein LOC119836805 n=1 Tax=Zerene cesonia TaxID=33412 RepID=UPI0018E57B49|nr:uncharacterized protein LOC119836805 [Zerene cesonia]XP_038218202.1 uncharacterized protein LOC119836805 [Zerene cesonia]
MMQMANWWTRAELLAGEHEGCAASRMWRSACATLVAPHSEEAWSEISTASPPDSVWHSLRNCVAYQAGVWHSMLLKGVDDVIQPAAFKLAMVLRHTPSELTVRLLADLLRLHPQSQDLTAYILALLTDDEAWCSNCSPTIGEGGVPEIGPGVAGVGVIAPLRDLQLFGDCELAVLSASREEYDAHAKLVRAEYSKLNQKNYVELRIKILNQLIQVPKLYQTPEFESFEGAARENIDREICTLREHLLTGRHD